MEVVPPRPSAVPNSDEGNRNAQGQRDLHIHPMAERGRMGWKRATEFGRKNQAETTMGRYKHPIGPKLRTRSRSGQHGEVALFVQVLNRMIRTLRPVSVRR